MQHRDPSGKKKIGAAEMNRREAVTKISRQNSDSEKQNPTLRTWGLACCSISRREDTDTYSTVISCVNNDYLFLLIGLLYVQPGHPVFRKPAATPCMVAASR